MPLQKSYEQNTHSKVIASASGLTKSFSGKEALDNIDLDISSGHCYCTRINGGVMDGKSPLIR